jgi:hypothetical protein
MAVFLKQKINPHLRLLCGAVDLNTEQWNILNEEI